MGYTFFEVNSGEAAHICVPVCGVPLPEEDSKIFSHDSPENRAQSGTLALGSEAVVRGKTEGEAREENQSAWGGSLPNLHDSEKPQ